MIDTQELSTDERVQRDVLDELHWDPDVKATEIGVEVEDGIVTLSGIVRSWAEHRQATRTARAMPGVRAVKDALRIVT